MRLRLNSLWVIPCLGIFPCCKLFALPTFLHIAQYDIITQFKKLDMHLGESAYVFDCFQLAVTVGVCVGMVWVCRCVHQGMHVEVRGKPYGFGLPFNLYVHSGDQTQVTRPVQQTLYPRSPLTRMGFGHL